MKPFLDSGFLLTLLFQTRGSPVAWRISHGITGPLYLASLQRFNVENRLLRQMESSESSSQEKAFAARALQLFRSYFSELVFQTVSLDYDIAIHLASQWQGQRETLPMLLLLWPALAVTSDSTHFLSFDPRTRQLAKGAGLQVLPESL